MLPLERVVRDIRRATRRRYSAEDKIRVVLDLRGRSETLKPVNHVSEHQ
jgi:transposase-like protein